MPEEVNVPKRVIAHKIQTEPEKEISIKPESKVEQPDDKVRNNKKFIAQLRKLAKKGNHRKITRPDLSSKLRDIGNKPNRNNLASDKTRVATH